MHPIESLFPELTLAEKKEIFEELISEQLIVLNGREPKYDSFILESNPTTGESKWTESPFNELNHTAETDEFRAKITFKGSKYLKEELQMQNEGKYNINVSGNGANNNFIIESKNVTIDNAFEASSKLDEIIEAIQEDKTIDDNDKTSIIADFTHAKQAIDQTGKLSEPLRKTILQYGSQISSIGNLVLAFLQYC